MVVAVSFADVVGGVVVAIYGAIIVFVVFVDDVFIAIVSAVV